MPSARRIFFSLAKKKFRRRKVKFCRRKIHFYYIKSSFRWRNFTFRQRIFFFAGEKKIRRADGIGIFVNAQFCQIFLKNTQYGFWADWVILLMSIGNLINFPHSAAFCLSELRLLGKYFDPADFMGTLWQLGIFCVLLWRGVTSAHICPKNTKIFRNLLFDIFCKTFQIWQGI